MAAYRIKGTTDDVTGGGLVLASVARRGWQPGQD